MNVELPVPARKSYIGSGDIASVLGCSPFKSPLQLYIQKRDGIEQPDNDILRRGRRLEPYVREMYEEDTGRRLWGPRFVRGPESWICASLDDMSSGAWTQAADRVLELKTANPWTRRDWGEEGTDQIPVYYTAQVQWQLLVTGLSIADLAALIGLDDFRIYTVEADVELQGMLLEKATAFWRRVVEGNPPDAQSSEDLAMLFPKHEPGVFVEATDQDIQVITDLRNAQESKKAAEQMESDLKFALQTRIGAAEGLGIDGVPLCTWKEQSRRTIDVDLLRAKHPEIASMCEKVGKSRVFRIK